MILIPARLGSTRFKAKILQDLGGLPLFVRTARLAQSVDDCAVAVDDEGVLELARSYKLKAFMTKKEHESGTQRLEELTRILGLDDSELIINLQADEPFLERENIKNFLDFSKKELESSFMTSCYKMELDREVAKDLNKVKVVTNKENYALYFSRSLIPYDKNAFLGAKIHLGIYGYKVLGLREFVELKSELDRRESLEQLRALENGKSIKLMELKTNSLGIDTKEDLELARARLLDK